MPPLYDSLLERMGGQQYGHYFSCCCPYHSDTKPSMLVFEDGYFRCLGCGKHGTHAALDKKIGSHFIPQHFDTVSRVLPRWRTWERKYGSLEGIARAAHKNVNVTYLKRRKIYEFKDEGLLGTLDGWITFPVFSRSGGIVDIVCRSTNSQATNRYVVGGIPSLVGNHYGIYCPSWKKVNESETVYVTFGIIDSVALYLAGLPVLTGITGKSLNADLLKPLGKRFIILPDANEEKEAHRLANQLGWRGSVKELAFPEGCKDADDIHRNFGNTALLNLIGA